MIHEILIRIGLPVQLSIDMCDLHGISVKNRKGYIERLGNSSMPGHYIYVVFPEDTTELRTGSYFTPHELDYINDQ